MPNAAVDTLRVDYAAISRGDWDALFGTAQPDFEFRTPDRGLGPGLVVSPERARRAMEDFFAPYDEVLVEPQEVFDRGDRIVVYFVQRCRPRGSDKAIEIRAGHLWTMREGRAAGLEIFPEREQALAAAGMKE